MVANKVHTPTRLPVRARVKVSGVAHYLGIFPTREAAALVADAKRRELMPDYTGIRAVSVKRGQPDPRTTADRKEQQAAAGRIRAWARSQGFEVADAGRLPSAIVKAYQQQHPDEAAA